MLLLLLGALRPALTRATKLLLLLGIGVLPIAMATTGNVAGYEATIWIGFMAPTGTPQPVVDLLNKEINKILARPDVKEAWEKQGAVPMVMTPDEFGAHVQSEIEKWAKIIKANAIASE